MKIYLLATLLIFIGRISYAEPIYLDCSILLEAETRRFSVKLDEVTNKITHTSEDGGAFNTDGFFTADEISYQQIQIVRGVKIVIAYAISRINLSVQRKVMAGSIEFPDKIPMKLIGEISTGTCNIVTVDKKRKI